MKYLMLAITPSGEEIPCEKHDDGLVTFWSYGGALLGYVGQTGTPNPAVKIRAPRNKRERDFCDRVARSIVRGGYIGRAVLNPDRREA